MNSAERAAIVLLVLGGLISLANWLALYQTHRTGRSHSTVPLLGAALLGAGMWLLPRTRPYAWIAVFLDRGTLVLFLALPRLADEVWSTSRFNLLKEYVGQRGIKTVYLRLFRKGVFTLKQRFQRPRGEGGIIQTSSKGKWRRDGNRLILELGSESAVFEALPSMGREALQQSAGFPRYESHDELSLGGMSLTVRQRRTA